MSIATLAVRLGIASLGAGPAHGDGHVT